MTVERLQTIVAIVRQHEPRLAEWLADGLTEYRSGQSLEESLELSQAAARARRDVYLRRAGELIAKPSNYATAKSLMQWITWTQSESRPRNRVERFIADLQANDIQLTVEDGEIIVVGMDEDEHLIESFIDQHRDQIIETLSREDNEIELAIKRAIDSGAPMPKSDRHLARILSDMNRELCQSNLSSNLN